MTETPLLDELDRLGEVGADLRAVVLDLADQIHREERTRARDRRRGDLAARVDAYLAEHPEASAGSVYRALGGTRQEVLHAVREAKNRFGAAANGPAGTPAWAAAARCPQALEDLESGRESKCPGGVGAPRGLDKEG